MKRILTAFVIAVGIHGYILSLELDRLSGDQPRKIQSTPVFMTLSYRQQAEATSSQPPPTLVSPGDKKVPQAKKAIAPPTTKRTVRVSATPRPEPDRSALQPRQAPSPLTPEMDTAERVETQPVSAPTGNLESENLQMEQVLPQEGNSLSHRTTPLSAASREHPTLDVRKARPLYLRNPSPPYPRLARRRGYEGSVILEVMVLRDGTVGDLRVSTSSGYELLDRAAVASVRKWLFEPGKQGDQKVDTWVRVPIRFKLDR